MWTERLGEPEVRRDNSGNNDTKRGPGAGGAHGDDGGTPVGTTGADARASTGRRPGDQAGGTDDERTTAYQDDGIYTVRIGPVRDRKRGRERLRWRVEGYYKNHRKATLASAIFCARANADEAAQGLWQDYVGGLHAVPDAPPTTLGELVARYEARTTSKRGRRLSEKTSRSNTSQLSSFVMVAGKDCPLAHLSVRHVRAAIEAPNLRFSGADGYAKPNAPATKAQKLRVMQAIVRWAVAKGWMTTDITKDVLVDAGAQEVRPYLQPEEVEPFLAACSPIHRIRTGFIIETGLRADEAAHLHWSWIVRSVGRPAIRLPGHDPVTGFTCKGKRIRAIPLSAKAQALLEEAKQRWGETGYVLHDQKKPPAVSNWCKDTHEACRKAGVTDTDTHGLRRTAGVLWLAAGLDMYTVSRLLGHQSVTTTEKSYAGLSHGQLAAAMDAVDAKAVTGKRGDVSGGTSVTSPPTSPTYKNGE